MDFVENFTNWTFLDEPLKRWFLFFGALLGIAWAWGGMLAFLK